MGQKYTRTETSAQIEEAVKDMSSFYRAACVNHAGTTYKADGNEYYTEIISEYLLKNYGLFNQIKKIKRVNYKIDSHTGTTPRATSNRKEERIALAIAQQNALNPLGEVIDYQVPLKIKQSDNAGKIDLMTFDDATGILRLIELKAPKSKETLLRCVLEIYTYYKTVDIKALIDSFGLTGKCNEVRICPLFFMGSTQNNEYDALNDHGNLVDLMNKISDDGAKVELLRFPFKEVKLISPVQQNISHANNTTTCDNTCSLDAAQAPNACTQRPIIMIPVVEQPNGFPLALEEVPNCEMEDLEK